MVELLWRSVERARREWPAGLSCCRRLRANASGDHSTRNVRLAALGIRDREAFHAWATAKSSFPEAYRTIKAINVLLQDVSDAEAEVLEVGRNECAVVSRPQ
ncbi:MAG: hypothetical protein IPJ04_17635 [Candidatus Eisenbacteria bacterium]|nr:hypothetical protein [Candidatus Eisenbacteria bacterium]